MNELQVFNFHDHEVRVVMVDDEPWFVAVDVAKRLGYRDGPRMCRNLDDEDKGTTHIVGSTQGGNPNVTIINESGLYYAVMLSRKPTAKRFKRWVISEVLPSIRKTGQYRIEQKPPTPGEVALQNAQALVALEKRTAELENRVNAINAAIDMSTIAGWWRRHIGDSTLTTHKAAGMGQKATRYCKKHDIPYDRVPDPRFGYANIYPNWVLDELFGASVDQ